jgi:hypothetical protein
MNRTIEQRASVLGGPRKFYLAETLCIGKSGSIRCCVSEDQKMVQIELDLDADGLTKSGVKDLIDALKKVREVMVR